MAHRSAHRMTGAVAGLSGQLPRRSPAVRGELAEHRRDHSVQQALLNVEKDHFAALGETSIDGAWVYVGWIDGMDEWMDLYYCCF